MIAAALVMTAGCGPACEPAYEFTMNGAPALCAEVVLRAAQERCDRPIVGDVTWVEEPFSAMGLSGLWGFCSWDGAGCPAHIKAIRETAPHLRRADQGVLAHELGHWCLRVSSPSPDSPEEQPVIAFARAVNDAALVECARMEREAIQAGKW